MENEDYHAAAGGQFFSTGRLSLDPRGLSTYRPLAENLRIESVMVIPLSLRKKFIGELILGSGKSDFFNDYDLQVAFTAAEQLSSAIEHHRTGSQTDQALHEQVEQLITIARVSRELNASLDLNQLLEIFRDETVRSLNAGCGSVLLLDPEAAADNPRVIKSSGCSSSAELSPFERSAIEKSQSFLVSDFDREGFFPPHAGIHSALIVPLIHQKRLIGLLQLHSEKRAYFDAKALEFMETLAFQAAMALSNAWTIQNELQRSEVLRRRADTLGQLSSTSYAINPDVPLEESLRVIAQGIRDSTPFQVVVVSVYEPEGGLLQRVVGIGVSQETLNELFARKQPYSGLLQLMKPEFKISRSFYIPADQTPVLPSNVHYIYAPEYVSKDQPKQNGWDPDDFLLIPLEDAQGNPLGMISLDEPSNGLRPDRATIDSVEVFAAQAALVINNARRYNDLKGRIDSLSSGIQRQQRLLNVTQKDLPILLHKDLEQTISLHNLDRRAQRVRAGLAITESVSRQLNASSALMALGRETLTQLAMTTALVAENVPEGPRLLHVLGNIPRSTNPDALFGQRNPLRAVLQSGEPILISNLDESNEWRDVPLLSQLHAKSVICLPVLVENKPIAAMLALSPEAMPDFTEEDRQVYYQISRQTSVVLQNISLLNETRRRLQEVDLLLDFSRRLSGLDPDNIIRALLDSGRRVLPVAHAGVVLMFNEQSNLLMPNAVSGYADNNSMLQISYRVGEALPGAVFAGKKPRRVDEIDFPRDYALSSEKLGLYRQATGGRLPVSSLLIPILAGDQMLGILILDNFNTPSAFKPEDEKLITVALPTSGALARKRPLDACHDRTRRPIASPQ